MPLCILLLFYYAVLLNSSSAERNNVCGRVRDYSMKFISKDCWHNPDVELRMPELIKSHGYPAEEYEVVTADGYILKLFRIPGGRGSGKKDSKKKQPVFLQHGFVASSSIWLLNGNKSIGFMLADNDYDVWLGNSRGSTYGKGHVNLSVNDVGYWNFSFHEMGIYDVPTSLDLVYNITGRNDTIYIGQSMGTDLLYVYASDFPEHVEKRLKLAVALAPTIFLNSVHEPLKLLGQMWPVIQLLNKFIKIKEVLPNSEFMRKTLSFLCLQLSVQVLACETVIFMLFGFDYNQFPADFLPVLLGHYPAGTSVNTILHLLQIVDSGRFAHFDHGDKLNEIYYHTPSPPTYDLSKVKVPNYIMYSVNDYLSTEKDVLTLYNKLPGTKMMYKLKDENFNHLDFYFAKDIIPVVMNELLSVLNNFRK